MRWLSKVMGEHEEFMLAYPPINGRYKVANDLFVE
jgi:hypothetical protein